MLIDPNNFNEKNIAYYRQHATAYINETIELNMRTEQHRFTDMLGASGRILDIGCGSGRDSRFFIDCGYKVTATDATPEIAQLTSAYLEQEVMVQLAQDINKIEEFDGVWACASLLHIPEAQIMDTFSKITSALKPKGIWYMSFKYGSGENWDKRGRFFNYYTASSIRQIIKQLPDIEIVSISKDTSQLRGKPQCWLNVFVQKKRS